MIRSRQLLFAAVLTPLAACRSEPAPSATEVGEGFYRTYIAARVTGAPSEEQLGQLAPYLSDTLESLLQAARRMRDAEAAATPGEKPPFADGDLFSSLFEGPTSAVIEPKDTSASPRRYRARLTYVGEDGPFTWTDELLVGEEQGRWVITDIEYGGTWDFATRGTLRTGLEQALAEP